MRFAVWLKVSRPGFWITSIWFYLLPVSGQPVFDQWTFYVGLFYVTFPLGMLIYGWNDIADWETDERNPRKDSFLFGARPSAEERARLPVRIVAAQIPFLICFFFLVGPKAIILFAALGLAVAAYNWPGWGFKNRPVLDMSNQIGYVLVFVLSSWVNNVPQLPWQTFVFGAAFAMHSHLFGAVMDLEPDQAAGRRTTAVALGRVRAKYVIAAALLAEAAWLYGCFGDAVISGFLAVGTVCFVVDVLFIWNDRNYSPAQARAFFLLWNAAAVVSAPWIWLSAPFSGIVGGM